MSIATLADIAALERPDAYAGEYPIAFVQLKPGAQVEPEELRDFVRERIAERAAVPDEVIVVPAMPLTGAGKDLQAAVAL